MQFINMFAYLIIIVLSSDLLYLYYSNGWQDPTAWIEAAELTCLYLLVIVGTILSVLGFYKLKKR